MSTCAKEPKSHHPDFSKFSTTERFEHAKRITSRVVDHLDYLIALHENNAIILHSTTLSSQIPISYARGAFGVFRKAMQQIEIVRLIAIWDSPSLEAESILTIYDLMNCTDVIDHTANEVRSYWADHSTNMGFGDEQACRAKTEIIQSLAEIRKISSSPQLIAMRNLRNKHLAHSLRKSKAEKKLGPIRPMRPGEERDLLNDTISIVRTLYCWINGISYDIEGTREMAREQARELWDACKFSGIRDLS